MKCVSLLSYALVIWGIFRSIVLSFPPPLPLICFFSLPFRSLLEKHSVCLVAGEVSLCSLWSEQLQSLLAVAFTDIGNGRVVFWRVGAHRKSTELNINPGCQDRMAVTMEDKEGHCLYLRVQGCIISGRVCVDFTDSDSYTVLLKQFLTITESGMGRKKERKLEKKKKKKRCRSGHEMLKNKRNQNPDCYVVLLRQVENKLKGWGPAWCPEGVKR